MGAVPGRQAEPTTKEILHILDASRMIVHFVARFTSDMGDEDIKRIIRTLAHRGQAALGEHNMTETGSSGIVFEARFTSRADEERECWNFPEALDLLERVWTQGWDGLLALPTLWQVKNVQQLIDDPTIDVRLRRELWMGASNTEFVACKGLLRMPQMAEYVRRPGQEAYSLCFSSGPPVLPDAGTNPAVGQGASIASSAALTEQMGRQSLPPPEAASPFLSHRLPLIICGLVSLRPCSIAGSMFALPAATKRRRPPGSDAGRPALPPAARQRRQPPATDPLLHCTVSKAD